MTSRTPTRLPQGLVDHKLPHPMAMWYDLDPSRSIRFWDDFHQFTAAASAVTGWKVDNTGSLTTASAVQPTVTGGAILFAPGSTATNYAQYQMSNNTTVVTPFLLTAGLKAAIACRFNIEDADQNLFRAGMQNSQTDPYTTATTDSFLFRSNATSPQIIEFIIGASVAAQQTLTIGTILDGTWYTAYAVYDGVKVYAAIYADDGTLIGQSDAIVTSLPDANLTLAFGDRAVDTGADDIQLDFITAYVERPSALR